MDRVQKSGGNASKQACAFAASLIRHIRNSSYACGTEISVPQDCYFDTDIWRLPMNALSGAYIPAARSQALPLKAIALFCGLVLGSFLCVATYGLDLSPGFF
jgi:hypothetical protein